MWKEQLYNILLKHKGKAIGGLLGFIFAVFVISIGFFRTIFMLLCITGGVYIGNKLDKKEDLRDILNKILPPSSRID